MKWTIFYNKSESTWYCQKKYWSHFHWRDEYPAVQVAITWKIRAGYRASISNVDCKTSSHFALGADVSRQEVLKTRGMSISRRLRVKLKLLLKLFRRRINPYLRSTTTTKVRFDSFHNFKLRLIYQVNSMQAFEIQFIQVKWGVPKNLEWF